MKVVKCYKLANNISKTSNEDIIYTMLDTTNNVLHIEEILRHFELKSSLHPQKNVIMQSDVN